MQHAQLSSLGGLKQMQRVEYVLYRALVLGGFGIAMSFTEKGALFDWVGNHNDNRGLTLSNEIDWALGM